MRIKYIIQITLGYHSYHTYYLPPFPHWGYHCDTMSNYRGKCKEAPAIAWQLTTVIYSLLPTWYW